MWQIFELTGSPLHLRLTGLARAVPIITFSLIGGVVADRLDRRKIAMFTQGTAGLFALILGILSITGLIQVLGSFTALGQEPILQRNACSSDVMN